MTAAHSGEAGSVTDPPVRPDRLCACGCGQPLTPAAILHGDPWATSTCCRAHHGTALKQNRNDGGWKDPQIAEAQRERQAEFRAGSYKRYAARTEAA